MAFSAINDQQHGATKQDLRASHNSLNETYVSPKNSTFHSSKGLSLFKQESLRFSPS